MPKMSQVHYMCLDKLFNTPHSSCLSQQAITDCGSKSAELLIKMLPIT